MTDRRAQTSSAPGGPRPRLLIAVTDAQSLVLLRGQLDAAARAGFDVFVLSSPCGEAQEACRREGATHVSVRMAREISPIRDLVSLGEIFRELRRLRPTIVNAGTPKAGLLVTLAAWLTRVPVRIHTLRGLRFETLTGARKVAVAASALVSCRLAHETICISASLRARAVASWIVSPGRAVVLGAGSSNGLNLALFERNEGNEAQGRELRRRLGIPPTARVVGFVGRLARDKGVGELAAAWSQLRVTFPDLHLLVAGGPDPSDPVPEPVSVGLASDRRVHLLGHVSSMPPVYAAIDLLVVPTYREGFCNALAEAAAMRVAVVATRVTGCVDSVADGVTGTLVPPRDAAAVRDAVARYLTDEALRSRHAEAGARRATALFRQEDVWRLLNEEYRRLVTGSGPAPPTHLGGEARPDTPGATREASCDC